jgi:hypothetical protein
MFINRGMDRNSVTHFLISKEEMLTELFRSKENGYVLGIFSATLGQGLFFCHVKEVWMDEDEEDVVILLHENAFTGVGPDVRALYLKEIEKIYLFNLQNIPGQAESVETKSNH